MDADQLAALRQLAEIGAGGVPQVLEVGLKVDPVVLTGEEVEVGGDNRRVLVKPAHLSYMVEGQRQYVDAVVGDVVLLTKADAKRLDGLGCTVEEGADLAEAADDGVTSDEDLAAMKAPELVAHVNAHPEDKARVRELELAREEKDRRVTILKITEDDADQ